MPEENELRYNSELDVLEVHTGEGWVTLKTSFTATDIAEAGNISDISAVDFYYNTANSVSLGEVYPYEQCSPLQVEPAPTKQEPPTIPEKPTRFEVIANWLEELDDV